MTEESEQDVFVEDVRRTYLTTGGITEKNENKVDSIDFAGFSLEYFCGFA